MSSGLDDKLIRTLRDRTMVLRYRLDHSVKAASGPAGPRGPRLTLSQCMSMLGPTYCSYGWSPFAPKFGLRRDAFSM